MQRTLRWQLSYTTTGPPSLDAKVEASIRRKLELHFGEEAFKLIHLRTEG